MEITKVKSAFYKLTNMREFDVELIRGNLCVCMGSYLLHACRIRIRRNLIFFPYTNRIKMNRKPKTCFIISQSIGLALKHCHFPLITSRMQKRGAKRSVGHVISLKIFAWMETRVSTSLYVNLRALQVRFRRF
jgi:hypothetical protein